MSRVLLALVCMGLAKSLFASDFGVNGLIDIPTARMSADGTLTTTAAIQSRTKSYSITYQAMPWLEGTFRYTGFNRKIYTYDRNYELKARLLKERVYVPQVAVGIRDLVGTGLWGAEYVVASKKYGNFDFTAGIGWGRLAGKGHFENPLTYISDAFDTRQSDIGSKGGELSTGLFFSGKKAGLFGGVSYQAETLPLSVMLEYNPDQYDFDFSRGALRPKPFSAAIKWDAQPGLSLTLSRQHNQEWGIELSAALDTKSVTPRRATPRFTSSLDLSGKQLPSVLTRGDWYDTLLFDTERSGLLMLEASIEDASHTAVIVIGNSDYVIWADAVAKMSVLADLHLPTSVNTFRFIVEEEGHRVQSIQMRRPSLAYGQNKELTERQISILPGRNLSSPQRKTDFEQKKLFFDVNLATRLQLFDPDDPARYQLYANIEAGFVLPKSWVLRSAYSIDIINNFDESNRQNSDSTLPHVRSDIVKYLIEGDTGLDSLYLEKRGSAFKGVHYRLFGGVLEEMYSGVGGEVLYQPFQSRLAYGFSANWVRQRDYAKTFKHLDYQTTTAFASVYWASPFYNFDVAVHAGRYLAKDLGATLEVRRSFNNGWMVGLWATITDVPFDDFGEGSFDKGMYFKIPFDALLGRNTRGSYSTRVRPIQRDGGQRLDNFSGNIWWDTRNARYDAFSELTRRMVP